MWFSTRLRIKWAGGALSLGLGLGLGLSAAWVNHSATAQPVSAAGVSSQAHPQLAGSVLRGQATLTFWGLRVYHARLWSRADFQADKADQQPVVLELEYLRDLKGRAIAERSLQEMQRAASLSEEKAQRWRSEMQRLFPDVKAGDRITGYHQAGQGAIFWHNDRLLGELADAEFARLFFGIWLAPTTSEPQMRLSLLGLNSVGPR